MSEEQLDILLRVLENFRVRPTLYIGDDDPRKASIFLMGFKCGMGMRLDKDYEIQETVFARRGWRFSATGVLSSQMTERGMSNIEMIDELVSIEIEMLKQRLVMRRPEWQQLFDELHLKAKKEFAPSHTSSDCNLGKCGE